MLEIGGELGALIVYTDAEMHGHEIEISRTGEDGARSHKEVLERSLGGHVAFAAVFDCVPEGSHTLWVDDVAQAREVRVNAGEVAELDWRTVRVHRHTVTA